jgi:glycerol-3-phosphate responsive antiterminator
MNQYLTIQNEELLSLKNTIQVIEQKVDDATDDIEVIKQMEIDEIKSNYFKDYILPLGIISVNYPIFWLFGVKGGAISSMISIFLLK